MSKLNVDQKTIKDLFQDKRADFLIPDYQRPYEWSETECQTLWDDIRMYPAQKDHILLSGSIEPGSGIDQNALQEYIRKEMKEYEMRNKLNLENVTVNTQSSVRIAGAKTIYFDPLELTEAPHDADIIFISHEHYDHFSPKDIEKAANKDTWIVFPYSMESRISETCIAADRQYAIKPKDKVGIPEVKVEAVPAYNKMKPFHPKHNDWVGYIIEMDGIRYYFAGDTDATEEAKAVRCDVAFLPIGGTYTTDSKEAAKLANEIRPAAVVPMHYGSIVGKPEDAETFKARVDKDICVAEKLVFV